MITYVWILLGVMAAISAFLFVERCLFHVTTRFSDAHALETTIFNWRRSGRLDPPPLLDPPRLGWLATALARADGNPEQLLAETHRLSAAASRYGNLLQVCLNGAPGVGLAGSICAMTVMGSATTQNDPMAVLASGMFTTLAGIAISVLCQVNVYLLGGRSCALLEQIDSVIEQTRQLTPQAPSPARATAKKHANNDQAMETSDAKQQGTRTNGSKRQRRRTDVDARRVPPGTAVPARP